MKIIPASYEILDRTWMALPEKIEMAGRIAYKSENKITGTSAVPFCNKIISAKHFPVLEFANLHIKIDTSLLNFDEVDSLLNTFMQDTYPHKFIITSFINAENETFVLVSGTFRALIESVQTNGVIARGVRYEVNGEANKYGIVLGTTACVSDLPTSLLSAEEVMSCMEKSEYEKHIMCAVKFVVNRAVSHEIVRHRPCSFLQECLSGTTEVVVYSSNTSRGEKWTINKLIEYSKSQKDGKLKLMGMLLDGQIAPVEIKSIIRTGIHKVFRLTTKSGRSIVATNTHKFLTNTGWEVLGDIRPGDYVLSNGEAAYTDLDENMAKEWHTESCMATFNDLVISIVGQEPEETFDIEIDHPCHNFVANGIIVHNSQRYCSYAQNKFNNEVTFIAPNVFFKEDPNVNDTDKEINVWGAAMLLAETAYLTLLKTSSPQAARTVLPNSCKTEIVVYATVEEWGHIFNMRCSQAAEPSMREVMIPLQNEFFNKENVALWE